MCKCVIFDVEIYKNEVVNLSIRHNTVVSNISVEFNHNPSKPNPPATTRITSSPTRAIASKTITVKTATIAIKTKKITIETKTIGTIKNTTITKKESIRTS